MVRLSSILLEFPFAVIQWANLARLQPPGDAVEVERMIADTPRDGAFLTCVRALIRLALDAQVHDVVPADGAVVNNDVPSPKGDCTPLLDLKASLAWRADIIRRRCHGRSL